MQQDTGFRELKMQVQRKLIHCLQLAEKHFKRTFPLPIVTYQVRGLKAGVAYLQSNEIRLNPVLLLENREEFISQVVPHELAHLIVYQVFGRVQPHGKEWREVMMTVFSLAPKVYHQFDITRVKGKTITYYCACREHQLTMRRHYNIQNKKTVYLCKDCKSKLMEKI
ncbi:SprT family zinc-dependent metalloprotease [Pasteurella canis]|nr:SprT family zinc-dependent metalloprotease [Pasteurella canis]MXN88323.1 SprT family zinc-dependent metalloprotease [Pasteurella canis]UAY77931.1 SprT family zinc-dependent metalloprotease [Pasteurella canis]UDW83947.1 SprT family zinc-dependent metalloprotease [Pasteurella canis]UEA17022.1 SprT family zinc-dependent metalloprotease [Pasteurella canis]GJJ80306.1 protein SprT [Pasteurella canis]